MFNKKSVPINTYVVASVALSVKTVARKRACFDSTWWWIAFKLDKSMKILIYIEAKGRLESNINYEKLKISFYIGPRTRY